MKTEFNSKLETRFAQAKLLSGALALAGALNLQNQCSASQQGTGFCYQGYLTENGAPANGSFDLRLSLFASGAQPVGGPLTNANVAVINGLFTSTIDFGVNIFSGSTHWMEMAARPSGAEAEFIISGPRQPLPTPSDESAAALGEANGQNVDRGAL